MLQTAIDSNVIMKAAVINRHSCLYSSWTKVYKQHRVIQLVQITSSLLPFPFTVPWCKVLHRSYHRQESSQHCCTCQCQRHYLHKHHLVQIIYTGKSQHCSRSWTGFRGHGGDGSAVELDDLSGLSNLNDSTIAPTAASQKDRRSNSWDWSSAHSCIYI